MKPILGFILRLYLRLHEKIHERMFHSVAIRYFGVHPKNIFHFRSEFFRAQVQSSDRVLDVACGTGKILAEISPKIARGMGLDYDEKNLKVCRAHGKANLEFRQADIHAFDYAGLRENFVFDKVIYSHILEHVENVPELLRRVGGGTLLICVPSQENWYRQTLKHLGLNYLTDPTHFREYTREMLQDELASAGYTIRELGFNQEGEITCVATK